VLARILRDAGAGLHEILHQLEREPGPHGSAQRRVPPGVAEVGIRAVEEKEPHEAHGIGVVAVQHCAERRLAKIVPGVAVRLRVDYARGRLREAHGGDIDQRHAPDRRLDRVWESAHVDGVVHKRRTSSAAVAGQQQTEKLPVQPFSVPA